jgi:thymidylate synthase
MSLYVEARSFAEAYSEILRAVIEDPDSSCSPRGSGVRELICPTIRILDPTDRLFESAVRSTPMRYLAGEFLWYFLARNDLEYVSEFSSFWKKIANEREAPGLRLGKLNSSYGWLLFSEDWTDATWNDRPVTQWEWALRSMVRDPDTRQAILHVGRTSHQRDWVRDFPCTLSLQMLLRDGAMHCVAHMRSNDLVKGATFDVPMFTFFQETFLAHYNAVAGATARLGHFTLVANSSHLYDSDLNTVKAMLEGGIASRGSLPLYQPPIEVYESDSGEWSFRHGDHFSVLAALQRGERGIHPITGQLGGIYEMMASALGGGESTK